MLCLHLGSIRPANSVWLSESEQARWVRSHKSVYFPTWPCTYLIQKLLVPWRSRLVCTIMLDTHFDCLCSLSRIIHIIIFPLMSIKNRSWQGCIVGVRKCQQQLVAEQRAPFVHSSKATPLSSVPLSSATNRALLVSICGSMCWTPH